MKKFVASTICGLSLGSLSLGALALGVSAKPAMKPMAAKTASVMCPACQKMGMPMPMTSKKTKVNTRAVKVNGKTMYCCAMCKMTTMTTKKTAKTTMKKM